jgi:hypothetical protein
MAGINNRSGHSLLDLAVAALAAGSVGFATYAMPDGLFERLIVAGGLPGILAAAEPPLGATARLAAVGTGALVAFALVWALLRALDRVPARRGRAVRPAPPAETPRLRKADSHPDAPARRPLRAGRDLGEPLELDEPAPDQPAEDFAPPPQEAFADLAPQPLPGFLVPQVPEEIEEVPAVAAEAEEPPLELSERAAEDEPAALDAPSARLPEAGDDEAEQSVTDLMRRLETGLSRREAQPAAKTQALAAARPEPAAPPSPAPGQEPVGHRLRSAINDLQKLAARGG